jgi:hypothetical protein
MSASDGANRGKQLNVPGAHGSKDVQDKNQNKGKGAAPDTTEDPIETTEHGINRNPTNQRGQYIRIGNAAVPDVVVNDDDGERDEQSL